ncbi:hypothetical protein [Actinoplanes sp. NPDC051851]|uniref:2-phosphosulfolactate phosphatase n=1 Tax=Actinoplanes sp. NPDC051851 TaxID=3154753 RepID=UPI0034170603
MTTRDGSRVADWARQGGYTVRFDWGLGGAEAIGPGTALVAVVDVLSFTTTLSVAADHGIAVLPYRWRDASAEEAAERHDAVLAVGRSVAGPDEISLSPATVRRVAAGRIAAGHRIERLVLPSPNGSAISARLAATGATVIGVSLRNAATAAAWAAAQVPARAGDQTAARTVAGDGAGNGNGGGNGDGDGDGGVGWSIAVIAAGERWPDGSLRPAVEDLWGAGAFLAGLVARGVSGFSPEAETTLAAYRAVEGNLPAELMRIASGRELAGNGFAGDVAVAAEAGGSESVPVLRDGWFRPLPG